jgi:two-component system sensor histidine kinase VicK
MQRVNQISNDGIFLHNPGIFIFNLKKNIFSTADNNGYVPGTAQRRLKRKKEIGKNVDLTGKIPGEDLKRLTRNVKNFILGRSSGSSEFRILNERDENFFRLTPLAVADRKKMLVVVYIADITAEYLNTAMIRKYANKKNSILNALSHDLRGPLSVANNLTRKLPQKKTGDKEVVTMVSKILEQSIGLIEDLIQREFLETIAVRLYKRTVNIAEVCEQYFDEYQRSEKNSRRIFTFSSSEPLIYIDLDEAKFMQVLNNLMTNALKFTKEEDKISLEIHNKEDSVLFIFFDTGIGIPKKHLDRIFDKFSSARRTGLNGEPSIGLGLSIVKTIVEWHEGNIRVESKEDTGTKFFIELPKSMTLVGRENRVPDRKSVKQTK